MNAERFWSRVDGSGGPDSCWPWIGATTSSGYGHLIFDGHLQKAHRVAYQLSVGPLPRDTARGARGTLLRHDNECSTRLCCNPAHLRTGTQRQNVADRVAKGWWDRNPAKVTPSVAAKLSWPQVDLIREQLATGTRRAALAVAYGVCVGSIDNIATDKTWRQEHRRT